MKYTTLSAAMMFISVAFAQTNSIPSACDTQARANPEIERLLKERDLKYAVCDDGDFKMSFGLDQGRSQMVFISSEIRDVDGYRTIHLHSPAYRGKLTKPMLKDLLTDSFKVGGWQIERDDSCGKDVVMFVAKVNADIMAADLETCARLVAQGADRKEEEWTDVDEW